MSSSNLKEQENFFKKITKFDEKGFDEITPLFVKKKIITKGFGRHYPIEGQEITANYVGELPDGRNVDNTYIRKEPHQFILGGNSIIYGLELGIKSMKIGEKAIIIVEPEYGYLPLEQFKSNSIDKKYLDSSLEISFDLTTMEPGEAKKYSRIIYEVELVLIDKPRKQKSMLSTTEKIEYANELKSEGINAFKEKYYQEASCLFSTSLDYLTQIPSDDMHLIIDLKHSLLLNIVNCFIHMNQYGYALKKIEQAMSIKINAKCYYYRALSRMYMAEFENSESDINKLVDYLPGDPLIKELRQKLIKTKEDYQRDSGRLLKNNLSSLYEDKLITSGSSIFPKFNSENKIIYLDIVKNNDDKNPKKLKFEIYHKLWADELIKILSKNDDFSVLKKSNDFMLIFNSNDEALNLDSGSITDILDSFVKIRQFNIEENNKENPNKLKLLYNPLYSCSETGLICLLKEKDNQFKFGISLKSVKDDIDEDIMILGKCFYNTEMFIDINDEDRLMLISNGISFTLK